ncbi:MAG: ATP-binding cassette domain-containing protein [Thermodesulfovibrionia bacterium]|nr:ATP-binding cassette domain-containing protein [Thermodesulfovibrionia bacterium]
MDNISEKKTIIDVKNLKKYFPIERGFFKKVEGYVKAVDGVNLFIKEGETLGLVGESGCGKTTLGRCILRAIEPTEGSIKFRYIDDKIVDLTQLDKKELRSIRRYAHMIFQDPYSSLDPRMTILDIIGEPLLENGILKGKTLENRVKELAGFVGLDIKYLKRYPHAFSGGQRQRVGIARSLATNPKFIIADEPVSALDVSVQAQILNLLQDLQEEFHLTFLFVAHDLAVIEHISDRVAVMYLGKIVELAETEGLFLKPIHPYTEALLSALPKPDPDIKKKRIILSGEIANSAKPPSGCYFHPRCNYAQDICKEKEPEWEEITPGHFASCHFAKGLNLEGVE